MPKAVDVRQLRITNDPNQRIGMELSRTPQFQPPDIGDLWAALIEWIKDQSGIDLSSPEKFLASLLALIQQAGQNLQAFLDWIAEQLGLDFSSPAALVCSLVAAVENLLHLDLSHGPIAFLDSVVELLAEIGFTVQQAITNVFTFLAGLFGLDFSSPGALFASVVAALQNFGYMIGQVISNTLLFLGQLLGLDCTNANTFLASIVNLLEGIGYTISQAIAGVLNFVGAFFGLDCSSPQALLASVGNILGNIGATIDGFVNGALGFVAHVLGQGFSGVGVFFESIAELISGALLGVTTFLANIFDALSELTGLDFSHGPLAFLASLVASITGLVGTILGFPGAGQVVANPLGELAAWVSANVFGFIDPNRLPIIPVSHIGDTTVNLLSNPMFQDDAIYDPSGLWVVDKSVSQNGVGGSAKTTANGTVRELNSVDLIGVAAGQKLDVAAWVKMSGVVASGAGAVGLSLSTFLTTDGSGPATIVPIASVSGYGTRDWQELKGTYVVPAGVNTLRVRIAVTQAATAGVVWFDNLYAKKQGLLDQSLVTGLKDQIAVFVANFAQVAADAQSLLNQLLAGFTGRPQEQATPALNAEQIAELVATTAANATALAALQALTQGGLNNMVAYGDDFERVNPGGGVNPGPSPTNPTPTPLWQELYDVPTSTGGGFVLDSGQAVWKDRGAGANRARFRKINQDSKTVTPYQRVARVTGQAVAEGTLLLAPPASDQIYCRVSDDFSRYMVASWDGDGNVSLGYNVGSGERTVATVRTSRPTAGSTYALECGDFDQLRSYRILRNNVTVLSWEDKRDATAVTLPLSNNCPVCAGTDLSGEHTCFRGWGWGGRAVNRGVGQGTPSSVHSITVTDIPPKPTIGSFLHAVRDTTAAVNKPAGDQMIPQGTFNNVFRQSNDIIFSLDTQIILLTKPGPYTITCRVDTGTDITTSEEWELLLWRINGPNSKTLVARAGQVGAPSIVFTANSTNAISAAFQVYNDSDNGQYALGFFSSAPERIVGSADGANTYLTVTKGT